MWVSLAKALFCCFVWVLVPIAADTTKYCIPFSASKTNSAGTYYCTCKIQLCPGNSVQIDGCSRCRGSQYFRLFNSTGQQIKTSAEYSSSCSPCAEIGAYSPNITQCQTFTLHQGCLGQNTCQGRVRVRISNTTSTVRRLDNEQVFLNEDGQSHSAPKEDSDEDDEDIDVDIDEDIESVDNESELGPTPLATKKKRRSSSSSSSKGYCNRAEGLTIGAVVAIVVIPIFCLGGCISAYFHFRNKSKAGNNVVPDNLMMGNQAELSNEEYQRYLQQQQKQQSSPQFQPQDIQKYPQVGIQMTAIQTTNHDASHQTYTQAYPAPGSSTAYHAVPAVALKI